jgi:hypothetical protein
MSGCESGSQTNKSFSRSKLIVFNWFIGGKGIIEGAETVAAVAAICNCCADFCEIVVEVV